MSSDPNRNPSSAVHPDPAEAFDPNRLMQVWRERARPRWRLMDVPDLAGHLDFDLHLRRHAEKLSGDLLSGAYRPQPATPYAFEKNGRLRRKWLPGARDMLALQAAVEALRPVLKNLIRNRDGSPGHLAEADPSCAEAVPVRRKKKTLRIAQEAGILELAAEHPVVALTDIADYFGSLTLGGIRRELETEPGVAGPCFDLLLDVIARLTGGGDAENASALALPLMQAEAPMLLGGVMLFRLDR